MSSDPMRFRVADNQAQRTLGGNIMEVHPDGPYVLFGDYARLQYKSQCQTEVIDAFDKKLREAEAEVERLTQLNSTLALRYDATNSMLDGCAKEIEEMEAYIERLTEAGDAMAAVITQYRCSPWGQKVPTAFTVWDAWNAAKKGGQP